MDALLTFLRDIFDKLMAFLEEMFATKDAEGETEA